MSERDGRIEQLEAQLAEVRAEVVRLTKPFEGKYNAAMEALGEHFQDWEIAGLKSQLAEAQAALEDIRKERSHGATANSEYIDRRISEGLGEGRA